jgi:FKBP-type peptidyl-prolyl cis-trans isomerase SlyD
MNISKNMVVSIDYLLKDENGVEIDRSQEGVPLVYIQGQGNIIPGLESALEGAQAGDSKTVVVAPEQGYGIRREDLMQTVDKDLFQGVESIEPGMQFMGKTAEGSMVLTVVAVEEDKVVVDGNHPLAGKTLHFDISVADVRPATEEELQGSSCCGGHGDDHECCGGKGEDHECCGGQGDDHECCGGHGDDHECCGGHDK